MAVVSAGGGEVLYVIINFTDLSKIHFYGGESIDSFETDGWC